MIWEQDLIVLMSYLTQKIQALTPQQRANRLLLKSLMDKYGFRNLAEEWWHFTLRNEPFPNTYFDFEIK